MLALRRHGVAGVRFTQAAFHAGQIAVHGCYEYTHTLFGPTPTLICVRIRLFSIPKKH
jgi:hypothetical protein